MGGEPSVTPSFIIVAEVLMLYITLFNVTRYRYRLLEISVAWAITSLFAIFCFFLGIYPLFLRVGMLVVFAGFLHIKTRNLTLSLLFSAVTVVLALTADNIAVPLILYVLPSDTAGTALFIVESFFAQAVTLALSFVIGKFLKDKLTGIKPGGSTARYIIGGTVITLGLFYANIFLIENNDRMHTAVIVSLLAVGYLVFLIAAAHAFAGYRTKTAEIAYQRELMGNLKEYTEKIEGMYAEMRRFKHDHVNILSTMYGYVLKEDNESLRDFLLQHVMPYGRVGAPSDADLDRLANIKIIELKGLLSLKWFAARQAGVDMRLEAPYPVAHIGMNIMDVCRVVGILLDNATEACAENRGGMRFAAIMEPEGVTLLVSNHIETAPNLAVLFEKGYSTKGEGRGMGLYNLMTVLSAYENAAITAAMDKEAGELVFELFIGNLRKDN
jgi:two-component system sensor histidine kinase AgrC